MNSSEGLRGFITFLILLAILTTGVVGFNYVSSPTNTTSQADEPKIDPLNLSVADITDSSVNISWSSVDPASTRIVYSKSLKATCLSDVESDQKDCMYTTQSEPQTSHKTSIESLEPETTYFFRILANGKIYPSDINHTFRTQIRISEPLEEGQTETTVQPSTGEDFEGFGEVNTSDPIVTEVKPATDQVLGVMDENTPEPFDPLGDIDKMMQEEFKEALIYNDLRKDFNKDGEVTMADYPLFIEFVMNPED